VRPRTFGLLVSGAVAGGLAAVQFGPATAVGLPPLRRALGIRDRIDDRGAVGLTFDDGPHPDGTPAVLEALAAAGAPATFFLVGEQVEQRPGLAAQIADRGHEVGLHCYHHRNLLRLTPREARADLLRGAAAIEDATSRPVRFFRPPFGYLSGVARREARRQGWQTVLWKRIGWDWTASATPASIVRRLTRGLRGGEVLVLHDADFYATPGSWRQTVAALPTLFEELHRRGLGTGRL
jgi:peptidoglycan-N-acetylglucosamine deacetylase